MSRTLSPWIRVSIVFAIAVLVRNAGFFASPDHEETGDVAANMLQVREAATGREWLGPYSRFGFHHPGPVSFYVWAAAERSLTFVPAPVARAHVAQLLLNVVAIALCAGTIARMRASAAAGTLFAVAAVFALLVAHGGSPRGWIALWGPFVVVTPTLLFLVASASFLGTRAADAPDRRDLPIAVVAAVFAVHMHVGTLAVVAPVALVVAAVAGWRARATRAVRRSTFLAVVFAAAGLAPLVLEELRNRPGNLSALADFARAASWTSHTPLEAARIVVWSFTRLPDVLLRAFDASLPPESVLGASIWIAFVVLGAGLSWVEADRRWRVLLVLCVFAMVAGFVSALRVTGPLLPYLYHYLVAPVSVLVFAGFVGIVSSSRRVVGATGLRGDTNGVVVGAAVVVVALVVARPLPVPGAPRLAPVVDAITHFAPGRAVELHLEQGGDDHDLWSDLTGLTLALRRRGWTVHTPADWSFLVAGTDTLPATSAVPLAHLFTTAPIDPAATIASAGRLRVALLERPVPEDRRDVIARARTRGRPALRMGETIGPGDPSLDFDGWYQLEDGFRWSRGHESVLRFRLERARIPAHDVRLVLEVGTLDEQEFHLFLDDTPLGTLHLSGFGPHRRELTIPSTAWSPSGVQSLRIEAPEAHRVHENARRVLGLHLTSLRIEDDDSAEGSEHP